jgi:hypothetical protein
VRRIGFEPFREHCRSSVVTGSCGWREVGSIASSTVNDEELITKREEAVDASNLGHPLKVAQASDGPSPDG